MAALAYLLPPVTGLLSLLYGRSERARLHGAASVTLGLVFPACLYLASFLSPPLPPLAVRAVAAAGFVVWVTWAASAAAGRDPWMPGLGALRRALGDA